MMPTFLFGWRVVPYQPSNQKKRSKADKKHDANGSLVSATNSQKLKKGSSKAEGTRCPSHRNNQRRRADTDDPIDRLFGQAEPRQANKTK